MRKSATSQQKTHSSQRHSPANAALVIKVRSQGHVLKGFDTGEGSDSLIAAITEVLANEKPKLSFPLAYCLIAARDWLTDDTSAWTWINSKIGTP